MTIRLASAADLPSITRVRTAVRENHLSIEAMAARGITHETIAADMALGHLGAWVAEDNGKIVAFAMANHTSGKLWALFTDPAYEGRSYGSALLHTAEDSLRSKGCTVAELDTARGSRAEGFYRRRGWVDVSQADGDPDEVYLQKALRV
jgi:GNAT superfamily N-acetyltransferase